MNDRVLALICSSALLGCAGSSERYGAPPDAPATNDPSAAGSSRSAERADLDAEALGARGEGMLLVRARTSVTSFLGATHGVVEDADGQVVAGADEESSSSQAVDTGELSLTLPAGTGYTLRLSASTADRHPTLCQASVGPLSVVAGSTAKVQVFAWDCGDSVGYVPAAVQNDCYWLAEWAFVGRTRAAVGDLIEGGVAAQGDVQYRWSSAAPQLGGFTDPQAAQTAFHCQDAGEELPLEVVVTDGACEQHVTQTVSCQMVSP